MRRRSQQLLTAVTICATLLTYMPIPDRAQPAQPPPLKVISRQTVGPEAFLKLVNSDPEMSDAFSFALKLGYVKFIAALQVTFGDGTVQVIGELARREGAAFEETAWLTRRSTQTVNKTLLQVLSKKAGIIYDVATATKLVIDQEQVQIFDLHDKLLTQAPLKRTASSGGRLGVVEAYGKHVDASRCPGSFQDGYNACLTTPTAIGVYAGYAAAWVGFAAAVAVCAVPPWIQCAAALGAAGAVLLAAQVALDLLLISCKEEALNDLKLPELSAKITVLPTRIEQSSGVGQVNITATFANEAPPGHHTATASFQVRGPLGNLFGPTSITLPAGQSQTFAHVLTRQQLSALAPGRHEIVAEADSSNAICELNENRGKKAGETPAPGSDANNKAIGFFDLIGPRLLILAPPNFLVNSQEQLNLTATLTDGSRSIAGLDINWTASLGTLSSTSCTTAMNGRCSLTYTAPKVLPSEVPQGQMGKPVKLTLHAPGGAFYEPSLPATTDGTIIPVRDKSLLGVFVEIVDCGKASGCSVGDSHKLPAQLLFPGAGPPQARAIPNALIKWTVDPATAGDIDADCKTDAEGKCSATYTHKAASPLSFTVTARFAGNQDYEPSERKLLGRGGALLSVPLPDLIIGSLFVTVGRPRPQGDRVVCDVEVLILVQNIGDGDAGAFAVGVFLDFQLDPQVEHQVTGLKAKGQAVLRTSRFTVNAGGHFIEAFADWKNTVKESNEANNQSLETATCSSG